MRHLMWAHMPSLPCPGHLMSFCSGTSAMAHACGTRSHMSGFSPTIYPSSDINVKRVATHDVL